MGMRLLTLTGSALVDRLADHVQDAAEDLAPHRHLDRCPGVLDRHPAHQAVGGVHGHAPHAVLAQVLRDLDGEVPARSLMAGFEMRSAVLISGRPLELHVHDGSDDLQDPTEVEAGGVGRAAAGHVRGAGDLHGNLP
jgi:hypothetical protein